MLDLSRQHRIDDKEESKSLDAAENSQLSYLVNHPPSQMQQLGKKTHVYGFKGILIETVPETDQIASLTLLKKQ